MLLVVEEQTPLGWDVVFEETAITALGAGTKQTGQLGEAGMVATLAALKQMFEQAKERGADSIQAVATMAARIAMNTDDFLALAKAQGTPVFVLSGEDEAALGFRSVVSDPMFSGAARISIIDPGGQSTELVMAHRTEEGWQKSFQHSFPVGTLGLKTTAVTDEMPDKGQILKAFAEVSDTIGRRWHPDKAGQVVVLGATGTNLVSIREQLLSWQPEKIHGARLTYEEVSQAVSTLSAKSEAERRAIPGMELGREKTIHLGALILEAFMNALGTPTCSVSVRGWRHALLEQGI